MYNRGFGGGFGYGGGGGGGFGNQFGGSRYNQSGFIGGPGNGSLMGGLGGGFGGGRGYGGSGGFRQQQRGSPYARGRGIPRGAPRGGFRNTSSSFNNKEKSDDKKKEKDETNKQEGKAVEKDSPEGGEDKEETSNGSLQQKLTEIRPKPASLDFTGPPKKPEKKTDTTVTEAAVPVDDTPPWEAKKKAAAQKLQEQSKAEMAGAPWEAKKKQQAQESSQKSSSAPWENKKDEAKGATTWTKKPDDAPPWQSKEVKKEPQDLEMPPWQQKDDKALGPPPWIQQQQQQQQQRKATPDKPKPLLGPHDLKDESLFDSRKRPFSKVQQEKPVIPSLLGDDMGVVVPSPQQREDTRVVLDDFNSDLNLVISNNGYGGETLNKPMGFCFCWAGARATYGVTNGKVCFEVKVTKYLPTDFGEDHTETDPHVLRIGWSVDGHGFQLGEDNDSFGFGGTGKFSANCRFSNYGQTFGLGDVIMALLDLEAKPPNISFAKNGRWFGVAHRLGGWLPGNKEKALFPHILSKNCGFEVNFGQRDPWFKPPPGFSYVDQVPLHHRVRGLLPPDRTTDCEMIMIVGLPGAGKTTWGLNMQKENFAKRYNIIGTDTLIDKMKVNGLPRKNNYHGRWDRLIQKATECLNKLFNIASKRRRNYILDQTNVYATARRRKLRNFEGFNRKCAVLVTADPELERRSYQRTYVDGKFVPEEAVTEMKANFSLPNDTDEFVDEIVWIEFNREQSVPLISHYNQEGQKNRPSRAKAFPHENRSLSQNRRDGRDASEGRGGHQRSFSDRGPPGQMERGRNWERNQDQQRGGWDRFQGGPDRDRAMPDRMPKHEVEKPGYPTSWQQEPGNIRDRDQPLRRDESPAGRPDDVPFKKIKVEPGLGEGREGVQQWPPRPGGAEPMDQGFDQPGRFGPGSRFRPDKDEDFRRPREGFGRGPPGDQDRGGQVMRGPGAGRFGGPFEEPVKTEPDRGYPSGRFDSGRNDGRFGPQDNRFGMDSHDRFGRQDRFPPDGSADSFTPPPPVKVETPAFKNSDNPFLARLEEMEKVKPIRIEKYVQNTSRDDNYYGRGDNYGGGGGRGGDRYGQQDRWGGGNRFGGDRDNRFGSNKQTEPFLAQGPGGFNKDRQDNFGQGIDGDRQDRRFGDRYAGRDRETGPEGHSGDFGWNRSDLGREREAAPADDRWQHSFPNHYNYDQDGFQRDRERSGRDRQTTAAQRTGGAREEWSGGGDVGEWQGGGGEAPPHLRAATDDSRTDRPGGKSTRWGAPTEGEEPSQKPSQQPGGSENREAPAWEQQKNRNEGQGWGPPGRDVDYRQARPPGRPDRAEEWGQYDQTQEPGWKQNNSGNSEQPRSGSQTKDNGAQSYSEYDGSSDAQRKQGDWKASSEAAKEGEWQSYREEQAKSAREEWSGGWGGPQTSQDQADPKTSTEASEQQKPAAADRAEQWSAEQYGDDYNYYASGYDHTSYGTDNKQDQPVTSKSQQQPPAPTDYSQQAYNQQGYGSEWNQYSGWEGYGQDASGGDQYNPYAGYGEWAQAEPTGTTKSDQTSPKKATNEAPPTSSSQPQYSSWSEYKSSQTSSTATTETTAAESTSQAQGSQYAAGHYAQTATGRSEPQKSEALSAWESSSYGYGAPPPPAREATGAYAYGMQSAAQTQLSQASLLGAAANISVPPNLDLNAIQQSLAAHGFGQPPPPPPVPAPAAVLFPAVAAAFAPASGLAGIAPGMYPTLRRQ